MHLCISKNKCDRPPMNTIESNEYSYELHVLSHVPFKIWCPKQKGENNTYSGCYVSVNLHFHFIENYSMHKIKHTIIVRTEHLFFKISYYYYQFRWTNHLTRRKINRINVYSYCAERRVTPKWLKLWARRSNLMPFHCTLFELMSWRGRVVLVVNECFGDPVKQER